MYRVVPVVVLSLLTGPVLSALGDDAITNAMSPILSYQYLEPADVPLINGGVLSPVISFQYLDDFQGEAVSNGGIVSPFLSYQYFDWPGDAILQVQNSPQ